MKCPRGTLPEVVAGQLRMPVLGKVFRVASALEVQRWDPSGTYSVTFGKPLTFFEFQFLIRKMKKSATQRMVVKMK